MRATLVVILFASLGCGSEPYRWPETDLDSHAPGAAFAAAGAFTRKPMPDRRRVVHWEFFYKRCALGRNDRPWFSATAYECSGPF